MTPNALMFDPDVNHPLVIENGQEIYIMMARYFFFVECRNHFLTTGKEVG